MDEDLELIFSQFGAIIKCEVRSVWCFFFSEYVAVYSFTFLVCSLFISSGLGLQVIRDFKTGASLNFAFIEFERIEDCERAYFKMDNVRVAPRLPCFPICFLFQSPVYLSRR